MKNVPKLRFNGFSDEWEEKKLGDFLEFYSTNSLSRECLNYESGKIRNIHYGDIHMKFPTILDAQKEIIPFINEDIDTSKIKEDSYCKDGDLIIADASEDYNDIGKAIEIENIAHDKVLAGLHTILARDTKGVTAKRFKGYLLLNDTVRKQIKILAAGAKVLGISKTNLVKVTVKLPSKEEQEKIANFLTKVDKLIEKQDEKVSNLEQYKKGMMQKIFSQEIRFKKDDGGEYPEWTVKKLCEVANKFDYGMNSAAIEFDGENKYIRITDIDEKSNKYKKDNLVSPDGDLDDKYLVEENDILFARTGASVGKTYLYDKNDGKVYFAGFLIRVNVNKENNAKFIFMQTQTEEYRKWIEIMSMRSGQPGVNSQEYSTFQVKAPCLEEQDKIANFLSKIDSIVEKEKEKLEEMRTWKKGLLQQMFV